MSFPLFPLLFSLILLPFFSDAQTIVGNITTGASLTAAENNSSSWISPSGDFAFGFRKLNNSQNLFLLAIWYDKIPEKTLVWYANGDNPAPLGSKLQLYADKGLVLSSPQGEQLWSSEIRDGALVNGGLMDGNGNFMVLGSNSTLWESFKFPVDTILPTQILDKGMVVSAKQSETSFAMGRSRLVFQSDGNLVLTTINLPSEHLNEPYYATGTAAGASSSPGVRFVFNESGYLFVSRENGEIYLLTQRIPASAKDFYFRATVDFDGVFALYSHPKSASNGSDAKWTSVWFVPDNICTASLVSASSGVCGFNSICSLDDDGRPTCACPKGYSLIDPNNKYGDCRPNFTLSCGDEQPGVPAEDLYDFEVLINVDWPLADYALLEPFTENQCRNSCLHDCMCSVAIFRLGDKCWKKKLPLSNGRVDPGLDGGKALLKFRKGPYIPCQRNKNKRDGTV
ncbi:hypothetical protein F3Y22_tig00018093pilonHSYRG00070 [Hibiscus syriacus]|uniref:Bulb-type lectin domain-containing protein n=2 Tax=Hibiscus syriacus TaxID=106335 RepID=A0A6A3C109_HIBSY|nr:hypothetical protein F3Y22_tig00018093pilonHSYRG00070 [Hibiscus syriacus]